MALEPSSDSGCECVQTALIQVGDPVGKDPIEGIATEG